MTDKKEAGVLVFGATRGTGLEVVRALRGNGEDVMAVVRATSDTGALDKLGVATVIADIFDRASVDNVFAGGSYRAVVLSLSGKKEDSRRPDREGVQVIVESARAHGVTRIVMVTAIGAGDSVAAVAPKVIEVLGPVLEIKGEAEEWLMNAGVDATILRPGGLTNDPPSGTAIKTTDHMTMGVINRADLGQLVAGCIDDSSTIGEIFHTVDPEITWQAPLQRGEDLPPKKN
jgi:uncharacterized protein YbjT (DUF2867 family)